MKWTKREIALAYELLNDGASNQAFIDALGRTRPHAEAMLDRKLSSLRRREIEQRSAIA